MANVFHSALTPDSASGIHIAPRWQVVDAAARAALVLTSVDIDGICAQGTGTNKLWFRLESVGPAVWRVLGTSNLVLGATTPAMASGAGSPGVAVTASPTDHVHPTDTSRASTAVSTTGADGLMSAADKAKLDRATVPVVLATNVTNSTITQVDVTALGLPVLAGVTYKFQFYLLTQTALTSTGIRIGFNGPAFTRFHAFVTQTQGTSPSAASFRFHIAYNDVGAQSAAPGPNVDYLALCEGYITPSANGNLVPQLRSSVAASQVQISAGSWGKVEVISP